MVNTKKILKMVGICKSEDFWFNKLPVPVRMLILGGSLAFSPLSEGALAGKVVDNRWFLNLNEAILNKRGVNIVEDTAYLMKNNLAGEFDSATNELKYGQNTNMGDFLHEVLHSTQVARMGSSLSDSIPNVPLKMWGLPKNMWTKEMLNSEIINSRLELEAYKQDISNAYVFGYDNTEMVRLRLEIIDYRLKILGNMMFGGTI
jgi:hypothetical protein